jgi:hypothetical protein
VAPSAAAEVLGRLRPPDILGILSFGAFVVAIGNLETKGFLLDESPAEIRFQVAKCINAVGRFRRFWFRIGRAAMKRE